MDENKIRDLLNRFKDILNRKEIKENIEKGSLGYNVRGDFLWLVDEAEKALNNDDYKRLIGKASGLLNQTAWADIMYPLVGKIDEKKKEEIWTELTSTTREMEKELDSLKGESIEETKKSLGGFTSKSEELKTEKKEKKLTERNEKKVKHLKKWLENYRDTLDKEENKERLVKDYYPEEYDVFRYSIDAAKDLLNDCEVLLNRGELSEVEIKLNKIVEITSKTLADIIYKANLRKEEEEKGERYKVPQIIDRRIRDEKKRGARTKWKEFDKQEENKTTNVTYEEIEQLVSRIENLPPGKEKDKLMKEARELINEYKKRLNYG